MKHYCSARFSGWIPQPGEVGSIPKSVTVKVTIAPVSVKSDTYNACMDNCRHPFMKDTGPYSYMQTLVQSRFERRLSDWEWFTQLQGKEERSTPPDSTDVHARAKSLIDGVPSPFSLCGLVVPPRMIAGVKDIVTCASCRASATPAEPQRGDGPIQASSPKDMHVRSTQGPHKGNVQTMCGLTVPEGRTESLHRVVHNQGKRVTCLTCEMAAQKLAESSSASSVQGATA